MRFIFARFKTVPFRLLVAFLALALSVTFAIDASAEAPSKEFGALLLVVIDADSDAPVDDAQVRISGQELEKRTDIEGRVTFRELPPESYHVEVEHGDYYSDSFSIDVEAGGQNELHIQLIRRAVEVEPVTVKTTGHRVGGQHIYRPATTVEGDELQQRLSSSVPATLDGVPGFHVQYNGPGATNPTIRGMPGDRVLMLEDGHRTGDIYWTAADHGVMVEPLSAKRMEVVRGPASLLYGSSSLGGVVNVVREDVPRHRPETIQGTVSSQLESVNEGITGGAVLRGPAGPLAFFAEATGRRAGDTRTPLGVIDRTGLQALNAAAGLSWVPESGVLGASFRYYDNVYDVPGEFDGELIPGGHPGGVTSEARRMVGRVLGEVEEPVRGLETVELRSNLVQFDHIEIERIIDDEPVIGASFDQMSTDSHLVAYHSRLGSEEEDETSVHGALGLSVQTRDLVAGGAAPGTRSGAERAVGIFGFEELRRGSLRLQAGLRYDYSHVTTDDLSNIRVNTQDRLIVKEVEPRDFNAISASTATLWEFTDGWTLGAGLSRSFRNPTIEEMYSDGPHLADFSFDIGSPDLDSEIGLGADLFVRADLSRLELEVAGYYNRVDDYIYYNPTGETVRIFREGTPPRTTPVFEARGDDALFVGAEGRVQWEFIDDFTLDATASYTRASRRENSDPLPFIPPLSGRLEGRYDRGSLFGSLSTNLGAAQNRVSRPIQIGDSTEEPMQPTDRYALLNAMVGWRHFSDTTDHTLMLQGRNLTNRVWRDHLSRIKDIAPQPGINVQLSYRMLF